MIPSALPQPPPAGPLDAGPAPTGDGATFAAILRGMSVGAARVASGASGDAATDPALAAPPDDAQDGAAADDAMPGAGAARADAAPDINPTVAVGGRTLPVRSDAMASDPGPGDGVPRPDRADAHPARAGAAGPPPPGAAAPPVAPFMAPAAGSGPDGDGVAAPPMGIGTGVRARATAPGGPAGPRAAWSAAAPGPATPPAAMRGGRPSDPGMPPLARGGAAQTPEGAGAPRRGGPGSPLLSADRASVARTEGSPARVAPGGDGSAAGVDDVAPAPDRPGPDAPRGGERAPSSGSGPDAAVVGRLGAGPGPTGPNGAGEPGAAAARGADVAPAPIATSAQAPLPADGVRSLLPSPVHAVLAQMGTLSTAPPTAGAPRRTVLTLAPAELGRIQFVASGDGGAVTLTVSVERPETLELIRRHGDLLERAAGEGPVRLRLEGGGVDGSGAEARTGGGAGGPDAEHRRAPPHGTRAAEGAAPPAAPSRPPDPRPSGPAPGRVLDLRL